jgi:Zn-dependent protease with chaperone function
MQDEKTPSQNPRPVPPDISLDLLDRRLAGFEILRAFEGRIRPVPLSVIYNFALLIVAILMLLLPLVYMALIACVAGGILIHATTQFHEIFLVADSGVFPKTWAVLAYLTPMVVGGILLTFMLKPFFARPAQEFNTIPLDPEREPLLFDFVDRVCRCVRSRTPSSIEVNCDVNASASFGPGFGPLSERDLTLTIGLPLLAGLDMRQLAGVLAHEFGHFSQPTAMRLSHTIRRINLWFSRVVYKRDAWDAWVEHNLEEAGAWMVIVLSLTKCLVWMTRRILWLLMGVGHFFSCFLLRQMEYNADMHEASLAGAESFAATSKRMAFLNVAFDAVLADLSEAWKERRLCNDLSALVVSRADAFPEQVAKQITQSWETAEGSLWSTHPADSTRVRRVGKQDIPGIFRLEEPASHLLKDYSALSRLTSLLFYQKLLGMEINTANLVSTHEIEIRRAEVSRKMSALARYLGRGWGAAHPLRFSEVLLEPPTDFAETVEELIASRRRTYLEIPSAEDASRRCVEARDDVHEVAAALALLKAGFRVDEESFHLASGQIEHVRKARGDRIEVLDRTIGEMDRLAPPVRRRLMTGLRLLHDDGVRERMGDHYMAPQEAENLFSTLAALGRALPILRRIQEDSAALGILFGNLREDETNESLVLNINTAVERSRKLLENLFYLLRGTLYPFEHEEPAASLATFVTGPLIPWGRQQVHLKMQEAPESFFHLYNRILGRLVETAEFVEVIVVPPQNKPHSETHGETHA